MDEWDDCSPTLSIVNSLELSSDRRNILPHKSHGRRGKTGQRGWGMAFQLNLRLASFSMLRLLSASSSAAFN